MKVVIASQRAPKVNGVQRAFRKLVHLEGFKDIAFESLQVESGVQATPLSIEELMTGARQRAEAAHAMASSHMTGGGIIFAVGVEGGVYRSLERAFLQSWACVYDGRKQSFGSSGSIEIPAALTKAVLVEGEDLGKVIDLFANRHDVRSNQGTWGILSGDLVSREDSFELATLNALAPFFNEKMYQRTI
ncbi:MAG TPA: inosine/xanthosine triphosphatase [Bacteroidota bacterium]|nr:inosine/xanthosine triphosphatase [Bacteroidota bacterium]